jgi:hypothetical protein
MAITLTAEERNYLKQLAAAGEWGRKSAVTHRGLKHLVGLGYVSEHPLRRNAALYTITDLGRQALTEAER